MGRRLGYPDMLQPEPKVKGETGSRTATALTKWLLLWRSRLHTAIRLLRRERITIRLFGDEYCFDTYRTFTARHPKLPLFQRKSFGVALRDLQVPFEGIFSGPKYAYFRRRVRRAERLGYRVKRIDPNHYLNQIMRINASSATRQGSWMRGEYLDERKVAAYNAMPGLWYGVLESQGDLQAYCHLPIVGDCCCYSRILGDAETLGDGIMYLLVHYTIGEMHHIRGNRGFPRWVMYDMFLGGLEGLKEFKRRAGFCPERVTWIWLGRDAHR
jgi:hypothetical protein